MTDYLKTLLYQALGLQFAGELSELFLVTQVEALSRFRELLVYLPAEAKLFAQEQIRNRLEQPRRVRRAGFFCAENEHQPFGGPTLIWGNAFTPAYQALVLAMELEKALGNPDLLDELKGFLLLGDGGDLSPLIRLLKHDPDGVPLGVDNILEVVSLDTDEALKFLEEVKAELQPQ